MIAALVVVLALARPAEVDKLAAVRGAVQAKVQAEVGQDAEVVVRSLRIGDASLARGDFEVALTSGVGTASTSPNGRVKGKVLSRGRETWLTADVEVRSPVVVAVRAIGRGQTLTAEDVRMEARADRSALVDPSLAIGTTARFEIRAGDAIDQAALERPVLVRRGDMVTAYVAERGFRVSARGEALDGGKRGDRVAVRIVDGKVVEALVMKAGEVEVAR